MGKKEKIGPAGRYGARYGRGIKNRVNKVEREQRKKHTCPHCESDAVRRQSKGIYLCGKCGNKFAGGAYLPTTLSGKIIGKMVAQKSFMPNMAELIGAQEEPRAEAKAKAGPEDKAKAEKPSEKKPNAEGVLPGKGAKKEEKPKNAKPKETKKKENKKNEAEPAGKGKDPKEKKGKKSLLEKGLSVLKGKKKEK